MLFGVYAGILYTFFRRDTCFNSSVFRSTVVQLQKQEHSFRKGPKCSSYFYTVQVRLMNFYGSTETETCPHHLVVVSFSMFGLFGVDFEIQSVDFCLFCFGFSFALILHISSSRRTQPFLFLRCKLVWDNHETLLYLLDNHNLTSLFTCSILTLWTFASNSWTRPFCRLRNVKSCMCLF